MLVGASYNLTPTEQRIIEFKGLNKRDVVEEGEMRAMRNLTAERYPLLCPRRPRGELEGPAGVKPISAITKYEKVAMIGLADDGYHFYYDNQKIDVVTGMTADTKMVAINTRICFYPQKTVYHIYDRTYKSMEAYLSLTVGANILLTDESDIIQLDAADRAQLSMLKVDDAINIDGEFTVVYGEGEETITAHAATVVKGLTNTSIELPLNTFLELRTYAEFESATLKVGGTVKRTVPDLDVVMESNNRLWGASNADNTIYACKLGDPFNWQYYQTTSMDSYYAQQGSDGDWTGCANYGAHLIFFKEDSMTKLYGTAPASYQTVNVLVPGVEKGSEKSVAVINDMVVYKGRKGMMAYDGGTPYEISTKFGDAKFRNVVGGTDGQNYFCTIEDRIDGSHSFLVLDIEKAVWHMHDNLNVGSFFVYDGQLCAIDKDSEGIVIIDAEEATEAYDDISWEAEFGPFDEYMEHKKIYSKLSLRVIGAAGSTVSIYIALNDGHLTADWEHVKTIYFNEDGSGEFIPIVPRRCDRYSVRIEGQGKCEIKELTRRVRLGTGGKL